MNGEAKFWVWIIGIIAGALLLGNLIDAFTQKNFARSCIDNGGYIVIKKHDTPVCREQSEKTPPEATK